MSTIELKETLINRIKITEDEEILREVYNLLEMASENIEVYKLSDAQKAAIQAGREDVKAGRFLTSEQFHKEMDEWLKE